MKSSAEQYPDSKTRQKSEDFINRSFRAETDQRPISAKVDISNESGVEATVGCTLQEFSRLDILEANAGALIAGETKKFPAEK